MSLNPRSPGDTDGLPSFFTPPHPEAVASRGDEMVAAAEKRRGSPLRWFQWLAAQRRYEVRADGSWCWTLVFESVARQQGKSVELGEDAAWFCSLPHEQPVEVLHSAHRVNTSLKIQARLWRWAETRGLDVRRHLGDSQIIWPDGSVWATVALESVYGRTTPRLLADEAWAMDPVKFWDSMFPGLGDMDNPQVLFFSAANAKDRGLVGDLRTDPTVCRMEWGALPHEDQADEATWRSASAYWGPGRSKLMRIASSRPGFAENWLNVWPATDSALRWIPKAATDAAGAAKCPRLPPVTAVCGAECSLDGQRWAVAAAWSDRRGLAVRVWECDTWDDCRRIAGTRPLRAHRAVVERTPIQHRHGLEAVTEAQHRAATSQLRDAITTASPRVAGITDEQWAAVRCTPADGGELIDARRSKGDVQAVKAAAWAVWGLQSGQGHSGLVM